MDVNQYEGGCKLDEIQQEFYTRIALFMAAQKNEKTIRYDLIKGKLLETNEELLAIDVEIFPRPSSINHCDQTIMTFLPQCTRLASKPYCLRLVFFSTGDLKLLPPIIAKKMHRLEWTTCNVTHKKIVSRKDVG